MCSCLYLSLGEHYWQGGPCWHTNVWIVSVLFFSSPLFPSLSLSQWCVQKRKSSSSVHLMVSTSRKLPAIRASAILMPCTLGLCSSPYIACLCKGAGEAGGGGWESLCTVRSMSSLKGPCDCLAPGQLHLSHFMQKKIYCWQCSLTLPYPSVKWKQEVILPGSAEQVCALPGHRLCRSVAEVPKRGAGALPGVGAVILGGSPAV